MGYSELIDSVGNSCSCFEYISSRMAIIPFINILEKYDERLECCAEKIFETLWLKATQDFC